LNPEFGRDLHLRSATALRKGYRLAFELGRELPSCLCHRTPSSPATSVSEVSAEPGEDHEAAQVVRSLVSATELTPQSGELAIVLRGDLAAILSFAADKTKPGTPCWAAGLSDGLLSQESLVAGAGFEPAAFRL